jgi:carboxyl-terminal processing protease
MLPSDPEQPAARESGGDPLVTGTDPSRDTPSGRGGYGIDPVPVAPPPRRRLPVLTMAMTLVALLAGGALFMSGYSLGHQQAAQPGTPASEEEAFQPFWDAYHTIMERYAGGDVDRKALIEGAIRGMIQSLGDPYSSYLTPEEYRQTLQGISGQFEGIGAEIGTRNADGSPGDCTPLSSACYLVVIAPLDGSPAQKAGILPGDAILAVDGGSLDGLTVSDARDMIRGKKGTTVVLTILRDNEPTFDLEITRDVVRQREVISNELADGTVGYVRLTGFSEEGGRKLITALGTHIDAGRTKIILDLRSNPGGFVTAARTVASQFIGDGPIFWQEDAQGGQVATPAEAGGIATDSSIELVVLVDRGTASASEIVAGAIQDTGRGIIVGEKTFGKGTVQQWTPLERDSGGFRLTIAKWLTPDKRWIHQTGVVPDVEVEIDPRIVAEPKDDPLVLRALELLTDTAASLPRAA